MRVEQLTKLIYSSERKGPFRLYIYLPESDMHEPGIWFEKEIKYPDEEISIAEARERTRIAVGSGLEVRICDGGDKLVFHAIYGEILFPHTAADFWEHIT